MPSTHPVRLTQFNHVALHVSDVKASVRFYRRVLGLRTLPRPDFPFAGAWLRLTHGNELHLVCARPTDLPQAAVTGHFALAVEDLEAAAAHLRSLEVEFDGPAPRPDGVPQLFLLDPDGHIVELCCPMARRPAKLPAACGLAKKR
jgi:catechol 2,3-dioxygenase-like lactoylglutathione lyase family enzyme